MNDLTFSDVIMLKWSVRIAQMNGHISTKEYTHLVNTLDKIQKGLEDQVHRL